VFEHTENLSIQMAQSPERVSD